MRLPFSLASSTMRESSGGTEVVRLHTGGEMFEAEVYGVGSGGHRREKRLRIARRGEDLRLASHGYILTVEGR